MSKIGEDNPGNVVVLIGTALQGPCNEPVDAAGIEHVKRVFGTDGTLFEGYRLAYTVNPNATYRLIRVGGKYARLDVPVVFNDSTVTGLSLRSVGGGSRYNSVCVRVRPPEEGAALVISYNGYENVYYFAEFPSVGLLVDKINADAANGYSPVFASTEDITIPSELLCDYLSGENTLSGGWDGLDISKNDLYTELDAIYRSLEGLRTDIVVPLGVYFDDVAVPYIYGSDRSIYGESEYFAQDDYLTLEVDGGRATFHGQLADFCFRQFNRGLMAHGVIGMRPVPGAELIRESQQAYLVDLINATCFADRHGLTAYVEGEPVDRGHYLSVVLGDLLIDGRYTSGAAAYAALIAAAGVETTTNLPVSNIARQRTQLDGDWLRYAADRGLVVFYESLKNGLSVYNGVTASLSDGPLRYIANVRTAQYIVHLLRVALDPYMGTMSGTIVIGSTVERVARGILAQAQEAGIIRSYDLNVSIEPVDGDQFSANCIIDLTLRAKYAVEDISVTTSIATT